MLAPLIWLMFYSFEGSVIEEELYMSGPPPFLLHLAGIGATIGLAYGYFTLHRVIFAILAHTFVGCFAAFFCASLGWYWTEALTTAAGSQILVAILHIPVFRSSRRLFDASA